MRAIAVLCLVGLVPCLVAAPLLTAYRAARAPVIDGRLDEACWQGALSAGPFRLATGEALAEAPTVARLCWDDDHLYVGIEATEPLLDPVLNMLHLVKADATGRGAAVFRDDSVELFLQPPGGAYLHFAANSGDGTYEGRGTDASWDGAWQCRAYRGKAAYTVEMAIPFAELGGRPEGAWRWNVTRHRSQAKEYSTWSGLQGGFHQPEQFGVLRFAAAGPGCSPVSVEPTDTGEVLRLRATAPVRLEARFVQPAAAGGERAGEGDLELAVTIPPAARAVGVYQLLYRLHAGEALVAESAPIVRTLSAGVAQLRLVAVESRARVHVNGSPVDLAQGAVDVPLAGGLTVLSIEAERGGAAPSLLPTVLQSGRPVPLRWRLASAAPDASWRTAVPDAAWSPAPEGAFWSGQDAARCLAVAAIVTTPSTPPLFPKTDRFLVPLGSAQLLRPYLPMAPELLLADYRLVVEAPLNLACTALEPFGAQGLALAPSEEAEGLRRHTLAFGATPGSGLELSLCWADANGATLTYDPAITSGGTHDWRRLTTTVTAPAAARRVRPLVIKWQDRGFVGTFWVDNVVFRREDSTENLLTMGTFDEPGWTRSFPPEGVGGSRCFKVVGKPDQTHRQQACWVVNPEPIVVEPGVRYVVELDAKCDRMGSVEARPFVGLLLQSDGTGTSGDEGPLRVYASALGGSLISWPRTGRVGTLPPLRDVRPRRARIAPCYYGARFSNPLVEEAFAENCYRSGITWTYGKASNGVVPHLTPRGHRVFLSIGWEPWSIPAGQREYAAAHEEVRAVDFAGKSEAHIACPTWLLSEGEAMLAEVERGLLAAVSEGGYAGANWDVEQPVVDPPTFCICPRCLAAFRAWSGLAADARLDAEAILGAHRAAWTDFRCMQNAELAGRLRAMLRKSPRPVEFSLYSGYQSQRTREHYGVDWARMAPHLDFAIAGYGGGATSIADTLAALGEVPFMGGEMWYLSDRSDARPTPRYETWRNRLLRQFALSGGHGCLIWYLPPMDGGAFYATSEAAELIAQHEEFFRAEQRCDGRLRVSGLPEGDWAAFARGGRVLVMLLNFSDDARTASVALGEREVSRTLAPGGADLFILEEAAR